MLSPRQGHPDPHRCRRRNTQVAFGHDAEPLTVGQRLSVSATPVAGDYASRTNDARSGRHGSGNARSLRRSNDADRAGHLVDPVPVPASSPDDELRSLRRLPRLIRHVDAVAGRLITGVPDEHLVERPIRRPSSVTASTSVRSLTHLFRHDGGQAARSTSSGRWVTSMLGVATRLASIPTTGCSVEALGLHSPPGRPVLRPRSHPPADTNRAKVAPAPSSAGCEPRLVPHLEPPSVPIRGRDRRSARLVDRPVPPPQEEVGRVGGAVPGHQFVDSEVRYTTTARGRSAHRRPGPVAPRLPPPGPPRPHGCHRPSTHRTWPPRHHQVGCHREVRDPGYIAGQVTGGERQQHTRSTD